jgi:hypothetical protein
VISNQFIHYNIFENLGAGSNSNYYSGVRMMGGTQPVSHYHFFNNVLHTYPSGSQRVWSGLQFQASTITDLYIKNNIIINFGYYWLTINNGGGVNKLNIENNIIFNNANGNLPLFQNGNPSNYLNQNNLNLDPRFIGNGNFKLQSNSPAINAGIDVGLTSDFEGNPVPVNGSPDIGAFEYGSVSLEKFNINLPILIQHLVVQPPGGGSIITAKAPL